MSVYISSIDMLVLVCALMLLHTCHSAVLLCDFLLSFSACQATDGLLSDSRGGIGAVFLSSCLCTCQLLLLCHSACHNMSIIAFQSQLQPYNMQLGTGSTCFLYSAMHLSVRHPRWRVNIAFSAVVALHVSRCYCHVMLSCH
jgi:hypothetical protein